MLPLTYVAAVTTPGSEVPGYIKLQSKNVKDIFEIEVDSDQFQIDDTTNIAGVTTAAVAPFGLYEDVARLFHIRADQAGTAPVVPIPGTLYGCVRIKERSEGYDNVVASGFNTREQLTEIWVPNSLIDGLADDLVAKLKEASLTIYKNSVAWDISITMNLISRRVVGFRPPSYYKKVTLWNIRHSL